MYAGPGISFRRIIHMRKWKFITWFIFVFTAVYVQITFQLLYFKNKHSPNEYLMLADGIMATHLKLPPDIDQIIPNDSSLDLRVEEAELKSSNVQNSKSSLAITAASIFELNSNPNSELDFKTFSTKVIDVSNKYDSISQFFTVLDGNLCFKYGTLFESNFLPESASQCPCQQSFYWDDCGIPSAVWDTVDRYPSSLRDITRLKVPKIIVNGVIFNHEFDMLEVRLNQLKEAVDIFIILESKFSSYGIKKPLRLFQKLQEGFLNAFVDKILYVCLEDIPETVQENGWTLEIYLRYYLGKEGLSRIKGLEDNDMFILSDADEIPTGDVINFLKLYTGFPEPVGFTLKWNVFGFFWNSYSKFNIPLTATVHSAASIGMVREAFQNNVYLIRKEKILQNRKIWKDLARYKSKGGRIGNWNIGSTEHYAGWHCSWCFRPEGIILKMDSAQKNDTPRWGDYPEKRNVDYIKNSIKSGRWFDDKTFFRKNSFRDPMFAPSYLTENFQRFKYLLVAD